MLCTINILCMLSFNQKRYVLVCSRLQSYVIRYWIDVWLVHGFRFRCMLSVIDKRKAISMFYYMDL